MSTEQQSLPFIKRVWAWHPESGSGAFIATEADFQQEPLLNELGPVTTGLQLEGDAMLEALEIQHRSTAAIVKFGFQNINGSLLDVKHGIICHQTNCQGVMGSGIALAIKKHEHGNHHYLHYRKIHAGMGLQLGMLILTNVWHNLWVAGICGQDKYGRTKQYTDYDAVRVGFRNLHRRKKAEEMPIYIPNGMGCVNAGGDWDTYLSIIAEEIGRSNIAVMSYHPEVLNTKPTVINRFVGKHGFLSNFFTGFPIFIPDPLSRTGEQILFPTTEHYFQAMKASHPFHYRTIAAAWGPGEAKKMGRKLTLRADWNQVKVQVMRDALIAKFTYPELQAKLIATGNAELIEGNTWNDTFWGVCKGKGDNVLGKLLMEVREKIRN